MPEQTEPPAPESLPNYLADGIPKQDDATLRDIRDFADALLDHRQQAVEPDDLPADAEPVDSSGGGKGTIVKEKVTCGDESCNCSESDGNKHGPYLYRYYYADGKVQSEYIGKPGNNPDVQTN
jgi:hypothetical protein